MSGLVLAFFEPQVTRGEARAIWCIYPLAAWRAVSSRHAYAPKTRLINRILHRAIRSDFVDELIHADQR